MHSHICPSCGQAFETKSAHSVTCSRTCQAAKARLGDKAGGGPSRVMICEGCSAQVTMPFYRQAAFRFCTASCRSKTLGFTQPKDRSYAVGNKWRLGLPPSNKGKPGLSGPLSPSWKGEAHPFTCEVCAKVFYLKTWEVKTRQAKGNKIRYCSRPCFKLGRRLEIGRMSPSFVGGKIFYRGKTWQRTRKEILERDKYTCTQCGIELTKSAHVHHIKPFRECETVGEANDHSNLIAVCPPCHMKVEKRHRNPERSSITPLRQALP